MIVDILAILIALTLVTDPAHAASGAAHKPRATSHGPSYLVNGTRTTQRIAARALVRAPGANIQQCHGSRCRKLRLKVRATVHVSTPTYP